MKNFLRFCVLQLLDSISREIWLKLDTSSVELRAPGNSGQIQSFSAWLSSIRLHFCIGSHNANRNTAELAAFIYSLSSD